MATAADERSQVDIVGQLLLARQNLQRELNRFTTRLGNIIIADIIEAILLVDDRANQLVNENAKLRKPPAAESSDTKV
jgi:hypothetical protein